MSPTPLLDPHSLGFAESGMLLARSLVSDDDTEANCGFKRLNALHTRQHRHIYS
jgi:hypothetical protein